MSHRETTKSSLDFMATIGKQAFGCLKDSDNKTVLDRLSGLYWRYRGSNSKQYEDFATFSTSLLREMKNHELEERFEVQYDEWRQERFKGAASACMVLLDSALHEVLVLERNGQPFIPTGQLAIHQLPSITARAALERETGLLLRGEEPVKMLAGGNLVVYIAAVSKLSLNKWIRPRDVNT